MSVLRVTLFSRLQITYGEQALTSLDVRKAQELFCYLLLHRRRPHPRETLPTILWEECSAGQSKKHLRQALWQLQSALDSVLPPAEPLVAADRDWIQIDPGASIQVDVDDFEQLIACARGIPGRELDEEGACALQQAVDLYRGDLLDGWYQDWCLFERERLQNHFLVALGKLMAYCEAHRCYEAGLGHGMRILRRDRAHERTHRKMMRLYYLAGDRTGALRQYRRCAAALDEELGVAPAHSTQALYRRVCRDEPVEPPPPQKSPDPDAPPLHALLADLEAVQSTLAGIHHRLQQTIDSPAPH